MNRNEFVSELKNKKTITVKSEMNLNNNYTAIDFSIDWPKNNILAEKDFLRKNALENSSIIVNHNNTVDNVELRLPPIKQELNSNENEVVEKLTNLFNNINNYDFRIDVRLADDGLTWLPHVQLIVREFNLKLSDIFKSICSLWETYKNHVSPNGVV